MFSYHLGPAWLDEEKCLLFYLAQAFPTSVQDFNKNTFENFMRGHPTVYFVQPVEVECDRSNSL